MKNECQSHKFFPLALEFQKSYKYLIFWWNQEVSILIHTPKHCGTTRFQMGIKSEVSLISFCWLPYLVCRRLLCKGFISYRYSPRDFAFASQSDLAFIWMEAHFHLLGLLQSIYGFLIFITQFTQCFYPSLRLVMIVNVQHTFCEGLTFALWKALLNICFPLKKTY